MMGLRTVLHHLSSFSKKCHTRPPRWPFPGPLVSTTHSLCPSVPPSLLTPRHLASPPLRRLCSTAPPLASDDITPLARQLAARVRATGAMTVAEFMNEVLVHPLQGYYTRQSQVGQHGDFVTAPEVAGMYGEMLAVWLLHEWQKLGAPQPLQLVELGPGRGTLMADILRVVNRLAPEAEIAIRLVEVSATLAETQAQSLGVRLSSPPLSESDAQNRLTLPGDSQSDAQDRLTSPTNNQSESDGQLTSSISQSSGSVRSSEAPSDQSGTGTELTSRPAVQWPLSGTTVTCGRAVTWHDRLTDVPEAFSLIVANEFFDALPVHQFRRTEAGWGEVLVDLCDEQTAQFRFVLARGRTPACVFIDEEAVAGRDELEVSPRAAMLAAELAERVASDGGAALVCDYGHSGDRGDTLRAFRNHQCVDPLLAPGSADVTCDVDFSQLARAVGHDVMSFGPVEQRHFLAELGLQARLERLTASAGPDRVTQLKAAYDMLTGEMGERFKMWALLPATARPILEWYPPVGFSPASEQFS
ncbi:protein arginine methyltransferase NDUFAF7, mitochondrial-like [Amphibalanus amphitrite]|uniref:protein arginine methyltransferase NDUFAF7, mitochondrial-like n=1 Tax=Amphibalanus amphitrite TaxID=1232801 RepID=UPI001C929461|nr:protein arginine methyltransferase NDUFAF7, mitochondrial-like [Amphibalanus amphitrite]XP_043231067.1 protein arginine methyltransferase NDUFAF7, mitochondrial-like [Amphibalanus amphitrite]